MHAQDRLFCEIAVQLNLLTREQVTRCMQAQQRDEAGKNIATLAVSLGFMNQAAVENVMQQQHRLLERRREAREASRVQLEVESRAAAHLPPVPSAAGARATQPKAGVAQPTAAGRAVRREPTPTSRWVQGDAPPENRLAARQLELAEMPDSQPIGNTLSSLPPSAFGSSRPTAANPANPAHTSNASNVTVPLERSPTTAPPPATHSLPPTAANDLQARWSTKPPAAEPKPRSSPRPPPRSSLPGPRLPELRAPLPPAGLSAAELRAGLKPAVAPYDLRSSLPPGPELRVPPPELRSPPGPELRSPPFTAAAASAPLAGPPSRRLTEPPEQPAHTSAQRPRSLSRPVPLGRDWRNPSRPPPPSVTIDIEPPLPPPPPIAAAVVAPTGTLVATPANDVGLAQAPVPVNDADDTRYVARALELCMQLGGSDLQLHSGAVPSVRVDGRLLTLSAEPSLTPSAAERIFGEVWGDDGLLQLTVDGELRGIYEPPDSAIRVRAHAFASEQGLNMVLHVLPRTVLPPERLGLATALHALRDAPFGLCICSGPTGSGKTTTLWSLAQALAAERALHIVSLESPLEIALSGGFGLFEQREVGRHVGSYGAGVDWAVAQSADVILVADLLAPGALAAVLRALRSRCLVLGGLRASSSRKALASLFFQPQLEPEVVRSELA
ncbi:MAG: ATPase, T2SS/T4P/T4SS family, partial [Polyangiales bacterium]